MYEFCAVTNARKGRLIEHSQNGIHGISKALIIDDEEDTCLLLGSILKQKSIRTTVAH